MHTNMGLTVCRYTKLTLPVKVRGGKLVDRPHHCNLVIKGPTETRRGCPSNKSPTTDFNRKRQLSITVYTVNPVFSITVLLQQCTVNVNRLFACVVLLCFSCYTYNTAFSVPKTSRHIRGNIS